MRRLVYAPKAHVFVRTRDHNEGIDITDYVVRGNVHRRVNAVSTAQVELRNPDKMFTRPGSPTFRPMDPITIFLTRLPDHPVQVFTGYLDTTPYLQLYPGTVTLTASCTLKRLLHTYWDPSLPYVFNGFLREYGWNLDPKTGQMFNAQAQTQKLNDTGKLTDGSYGKLLYGTLLDVARWDHDSIYIEKLPDGIVEKVTSIYSSIAKENDGIAENVQALFSSMLGTGANGGGGGLLGADATDSDVQRGDLIGTVATTAYGPPWDGPQGMQGGGVTAGGTDLRDGKRRYIVAADLTVYPMGTKLYIDPNPYNHTGTFTVDDTGGYFKPGGPRAGGIDFYIAEGRAKQMEWGRKDVKVYRADKKAADASKPQSGAAPAPATPEKDTKSKDSGGDGKWAYPLAKMGQSLGGVMAHKSRPLGNWESDEAIDLGNPAGTAWIAVEDGVISKTLGWGDSSGSGHATVYGYRLHLEGDSGNVYFYQHGASNIAPQGKRVKKGDKIGEIGDYSANGIPLHLHFAAQPPTNPEVVVQQGKITAGGSDTTTGGSGGSGTSGDASSASVFAAYLNLPNALDTAEAIGLSGQKSMLNDEPLFPFIEQLCQGSLRNFMSMPNGNFYAFFPDYFGGFGHRTPYWVIDDIEVLDGGIDLSDEFLATHVYIVGDTNFTGGIDFMDKLNSGGVMDVESALKSGFIRNLDMTHGEVIDFLRKYGVRPYKEELPMIRSPYFEAFLAYQKFMQLWAKQFSTRFQFTFMPELYPGGLVGLLDHGIQCYLEEVIHTFDYENGFTTDAMLSSPAAMVDSGVTEVSAGMVQGFDTASVPPTPPKPGNTQKFPQPTGARRP